MFEYFGIFLGAAGVSAVLTWAIRQLALGWGIVDRPSSAPQRKHHPKAIPLLGGLAIYITFVGFVLWLAPGITTGYLLYKHIVGIVLAGAVICLGGILDDKFTLSAKVQFIFPVLAALIVVASGVGVHYITNPLGGVIQFNQWTFTVFSWNALPYKLTLLADAFTIIWLLGTMYTTKLLDGVDGLVSGITVIGGVIIFFVSSSQIVAQPETAILALILAGAATGFLLWNFPPAKIFLGEGGSVFTGFMLGVLAILSGGKIATALLILGLPIIDLSWVIVRRMFVEKKSPFSADTLHLHFQLRKLGLSSRHIVLLFYIITIVFGTSTLFTSGPMKVIVLLALAVVSLAALFWLFVKSNEKT